MNDALSVLATLSSKWGHDPLLTQGAGGNTSLKTPSALVIKASGKRLSRALEENIFVEMSLSKLNQALAQGDEYDFNRDLNGALRGSIETPLHAVIPHEVVVHLHSVRTLAFAVRRDGAEALSQKLSGLPWAWVPYAKPGWPLTWELQRTLAAAPKVWVLQNHGLIVAGSDLSEVARLLEEVERRLDGPVRLFPEPGRAFFDELAKVPEWRTPRDGRAHLLALENSALEIVTKGVIYPDQVVFLGRSLAVAESLEELPRYVGSPLVIVRGHGVVVAEGAVPGVDDMLTCLSLLCSRLAAGIEVTYLSAPQVDELVDWDAEKHRQMVDRNVT